MEIDSERSLLVEAYKREGLEKETTIEKLKSIIRDKEIESEKDRVDLDRLNVERGEMIERLHQVEMDRLTKERESNELMEEKERERSVNASLVNKVARMEDKVYLGHRLYFHSHDRVSFIYLLVMQIKDLSVQLLTYGDRLETCKRKLVESERCREESEKSALYYRERDELNSKGILNECHTFIL